MMQQDRNKGYGHSLYYKIWVTKGSRFNAHKRYLILNSLSNQAVGYTAAYLLILNLLSVYNFPKNNPIPQDANSFFGSALSIIILVFSLVETSNDYKLNADKMHSCAKEMGLIYNKLEKLILSDQPESVKQEGYEKLADQYQSILDKYDNHDPIDFSLFKARNKNEFQFSRLKVFRVQVEYYIYTQLKYHLIIVFPVVVFMIYLFSS